MTLRFKLAVALTFAALLPMAVAISVPMLQAERRAREEAERRLDSARGRATIIIERTKDDAASRVGRAAADIAHDRSGRESLLEGPESAARVITRSLADRYGLDHLEILNARGTVLSTSRLDAGAGLPSPLADAVGEDVVLLPLPGASSRETAPVAFFSRRGVPLGGESLSLIGGRGVGHEFITGLAEIVGEPSALLDGSGSVVDSAGGPQAAGERISGEVPLEEGGWMVTISVPAGDPGRVRRDLLGTFAGIAPLVLASALAVGILLAQGISRPIRALAARAEEISAARSGPFSLLPERNEVRRLTSSFDRMLETLGESERQRIAAERIAAWQEVARRIAHEVKNPLSPIKLAVENLRRTREKAPAELDHALEVETATILEEVESLRRLVDEFSLFARLPTPRPVPCDLRQVLSQALALFTSRIEAERVRVEVADEGAPLTVAADPDQIGRALKNILSNAIDALERVTDRRVRIALRRVAQGSAAEIEISDSGVGFEPETLRRVFEPYFTTRADRGGTGLGMAIAYRIVTEHGGTIRATGSSGRGATITLRLPVEGPSASPA